MSSERAVTAPPTAPTSYADLLHRVAANAIDLQRWLVEEGVDSGESREHTTADAAGLLALARLVRECEELSEREPSYVAPLIHEIAAGYNPLKGAQG